MKPQAQCTPISALRGRELFGINVRSLRMTKGLSQEKLGDACSLHRTYIGSIERGERNISIDSMERIATALGVEVPDLLRVADRAPDQ